MTDTGRFPDEGQPENAGALPGHPLPADAAGPADTGSQAPYTFIDHDAADEDDLLLMPGAQGAWMEQPAATGGTHETGGRDTGSVDYTGVRTTPPAAAAPAPRRPLHMGPPVPEPSTGVVRSLADRGPAAPQQPVGAPARQAAPQAGGVEYLDAGPDETLGGAPATAFVPAQNTGAAAVQTAPAPVAPEMVAAAPAVPAEGAAVAATTTAGGPAVAAEPVAEAVSAPAAQQSATPEETPAHGLDLGAPQPAPAVLQQDAAAGVLGRLAAVVSADAHPQGAAQPAGETGGADGTPLPPSVAVPADGGAEAAAPQPVQAPPAPAQEAPPAPAPAVAPEPQGAEAPPTWELPETPEAVAVEAPEQVTAPQPEAVAEPVQPAQPVDVPPVQPEPAVAVVADAPEAVAEAVCVPAQRAVEEAQPVTDAAEPVAAPVVAEAVAPDATVTTAEAAPAQPAAAPEPQAPAAPVVPQPQAPAAPEAEAVPAQPEPVQAPVAQPEPEQPVVEQPAAPVTDQAAVPQEPAAPQAAVAPQEPAAVPVEQPAQAPAPVTAPPAEVPAPAQDAEAVAPAPAPQQQAPVAADAAPAAPQQHAPAEPAPEAEPVPVQSAPSGTEEAQPAQASPVAPEVQEPQAADVTPQSPEAPQTPEAPEAVEAPEALEAQEPAAAPEPVGPPAPAFDESERAAVHRVIRERRDIRNGFRTDPIPHEVLLRVLEAAHTAPSVGHSQPWDFVVIRSAETRKAMHELAVRQREAYAKSLPKARAKQFTELKIEAILETPVNIVVTADPTRGGRHTLGRHTQPQMAPYSSALAVENLWLAARAEGLGVGWVSFFDEREMVRELGLPEHLEVVAYLCVGYVDEFPDEPELMQAGWSKRRPLSWVVHEETYGRRALPGEDPHDLLAETLRGIRPLDAKALGEAWERQKRMTKPSGALGMLEIISAQLCGLSRKCPPPIPEPAAVAIFAGDHGVHHQGVTAWPQEVTSQMVANFLGGGAVCNAFAKQVGAEVCVVDVGVASELPSTPGLLPRKIRPGTSDFTTGPAMSREEALRAVEVGIETARDLVTAGNKALLTGEMGIANTTVSAALIAVFTGADPAEITGRGTGINDEMHARKIDVVRRALELHRPDPEDPIGVLAAVGGLEHAALVGLILGGASLRTPVILDGVSAGAAALVARAIAPEALAACIAGHRSAEPGHVAALTKLGLRPLVDLDLRLGEGTGALLALPVVQSAARAMHEVATFDTAGVTEKG
ncbi:nicotinate-nucleotide--dimethylbenzimidazole phosphoribosyltransferase [Streptomyces cinnamoneus]|uniref:nicotinate-nucleotide--dimethylbenzimidazole phosphoribosyltransferase n=1 Tax=Streptomyces cinnamoneus TaxID=53446 RepID=UPI0037A22BE9